MHFMQVTNLILRYLSKTDTSPRSCIVDKTGERFLHVAGWWWAVILGYIIALSTFSITGRYVSLFLMACGDVGQSCSQLLTLPIADS